MNAVVMFKSSLRHSVSMLLCLLHLLIITNIQIVSSAYTNVPQEYTLTNVAVLIRHGDRIQITKDLGNVFHDSKNVTRFWKLKLPNENTLRSLARSAYPYVASNSSFDNLRKRLYSGWDIVHFPYGQLTERGSHQLKHVGRKFWRRYHDFLLDDHSLSSIDTMYCRSTNICRTLLSLRSFLTGFFYKDGSSSLGSRPHSYRPGYSRNRSNNNNNNNNNAGNKYNNNNPVNEATAKDEKFMKETMDILQISLWNMTKLPIIIARPKSFETMYPGSCDYLAKRRAVLIESNYNNASYIPSYFNSLEERLHKVLSIPRPFNWLTWLNVMEILTVMDIHNVSLPDGLNRTDMMLTTDLVSWMWGALYKVRTFMCTYLCAFILMHTCFIYMLFYMVLLLIEIIFGLYN